MRFNKYSFIAAISVILSACSAGDGSKETYTSDEAYRMGQTQAARIIMCDDEAALQDSLLEIRSRIYHIEVNVGEKQSREYERGFIDYIKEHDESLAKVLF